MVEERKFIVMEISELDKGFLVTVMRTTQNRVVTAKEMFAFDDSQKDEMLELIKREFKIE